MMDVGWKQSAARLRASARGVVLKVVLALATLSRMGPKRESGFRGPNGRGGRRTLFAQATNAYLKTARFGVHLRRPSPIPSPSLEAWFGRGRAHRRFPRPRPGALASPSRRRGRARLRRRRVSAGGTLCASMSFPSLEREPSAVLCFAAEGGDVILARECIARGADVNYVDERDGTSPLNLAAGVMGDTSFPDMIKCLLINGASVAGESRTCSSLTIAASRGVTESVALLLAAGAVANGSALHNAISNCTSSRATDQSVEVVQLLLQAGAMANELTPPYAKASRTLTHALLGGRRDLVKVLLRAGAERVAISDCQPTFAWRSGRPAALAVIESVEAIGGWTEYARKHKRVLAGLVAKCTPLPDEAARVVVAYWCPEGGY